jgi:hypothetical protein
MISRELAIRLAPYVSWVPQNGDWFFIQRPEIADATFLVSDMVVEHVPHERRPRFHFNGTTEWALDSVEVAAAVWLPGEQQLRDRLGSAFLSLDRVGEGYLVTVLGPAGTHHTAPVPEVSDAYALALLHIVGGDESSPASGEAALLQAR